MPQLLPILTNPNPQLRVRAADVDPATLADSGFKEFIKNFSHTMIKEDGVGLAAIQVGVPKRIIVIKDTAVRPDHPELLKDSSTGELILINPVWLPLSQKKHWDTEGCLSVPGKFGDVERFTTIQVTALGEQGQKLSFTAHDFFARVIQHEVDHLDGILFIDKAKKIKEYVLE